MIIVAEFPIFDLSSDAPWLEISVKIQLCVWCVGRCCVHKAIAVKHSLTRSRLARALHMRSIATKPWGYFCESETVKYYCCTTKARAVSSSHPTWMSMANRTTNSGKRSLIIYSPGLYRREIRQTNLSLLARLGTVTHCWYPRTKECSSCYKNNEREYMCDQEIQRALPVITMMGS